ncbi:PREDICTED: probable methyltransferase PMT27 isoform X1 [Brassica oleracea var. oleracea]|uniref:probable methyltransferase PMT27 isoform X1 n=1 Tax=Brassica oleracea var. oleracea TaxID=109376 RepID=UPI0006A6E5B9|nr:PREDICTED: probable methyltransferase PMT27 isoform X1 [Brassica oleracea var. oleracea]
MAFGKGRGNKRTSTSSYASTITMVVFVALCVIGVWMLSTNSFIPSQITQATTRTVIAETERSDVSASSNGNEEPEPTKPESDEHPTFQDNPGKLPDDAVKSEDEQQKSAKEKTNSKAGDEGERQNQKQETETQQNNEKENKKNDEGQVKEVVKEFEKEQKEQREEDAGSQPGNNKGTQEQENVQGKDMQDVKQGQDQDSNTDVTYTDATKEELPLENQENGQQQQQEGQNSKNEENGQQQQQQQEDQNSGKEESGQQNMENNNMVNDENVKEQKNMKDENGQQDEQSTTKEENVEQQQAEQNDEKKQEGAGASGFGSGIPKESAESQKSWKSQATESKDEKQRQTSESNNADSIMTGKAWELCNATAAYDYIPCLDNEEAIKKLTSRGHFEHRERHCPEDPPTCLVSLPEGYKESIKWPESRDKIWYHNVPHTKLAEVKGHQNWVKVTGEFLTFPGGGTQFIHGALHYIDFLQQSVKSIAWGKSTRVVLDVGCGVASFGGFLFERDVIAMSLAPKDEHEAQVQFALERKIPAISAVMGTKRLPFPSRVFDLIHCARCRVPWHNDGGMLLLELNRMLRPGGYFVWSATPVYQKLEEDVQIWKEMSALTKSMCWELVTINKDKLNGIGAAIYQKPTTNECYEKRKHKKPPMCKNNDDSNAAWYVPLQACMHKVPTNVVERGSKWPVSWPRRLQTPPYWLNSSQMGIYGKPAPLDFTTDYEHWKHVVSKVYMNEMGISWSNVRNVMDMRAVYGGFAAALKDLQVWVMNVVNINSPDTLPIIYERGLFGIYHDWCESFSTYPRSYDLLHADHLFSKLKARCNLVPVMAEVDRIVRPGGKLIVRDEANVIREIENMLKSLHWDVHLTFSKHQEGILSAQKGFWRPDTSQTST